MVFFDPGSSRIRSQTDAILQTAAMVYRSAGYCHIWLAGHADRVGSAERNRRLALRRAETIAAYFRRQLPRAEFEPVSFREERPLVETADEVAEAQNRRVEFSARCDHK